MKKLYLKPSTRVIHLQPRGILAYSNRGDVSNVSNQEGFTFDGKTFDDAEEDF